MGLDQKWIQQRTNERWWRRKKLVKKKTASCTRPCITYAPSSSDIEHIDTPVNRKQATFKLWTSN